MVIASEWHIQRMHENETQGIRPTQTLCSPDKPSGHMSPSRHHSFAITHRSCAQEGWNEREKERERERDFITLLWPSPLASPEPLYGCTLAPQKWGQSWVWVSVCPLVLFTSLVHSRWPSGTHTTSLEWVWQLCGYERQPQTLAMWDVWSCFSDFLNSVKSD